MPDNENDLQPLLHDIRNLLVLVLMRLEVKGGEIAKAVGISKGRLSQMLNPGKYRTSQRRNRGRGGRK